MPAKTDSPRPLDRLRLMARRQVDDELGSIATGLARQVAERRRALDLSQRELAELCATTQSAIARLEKGGRPPRIDTLLRIANALDCEFQITFRPRTTRGGKR